MAKLELNEVLCNNAHRPEDAAAFVARRVDELLGRSTFPQSAVEKMPVIAPTPVYWMSPRTVACAICICVALGFLTFALHVASTQVTNAYLPYILSVYVWTVGFIPMAWLLQDFQGTEDVGMVNVVFYSFMIPMIFGFFPAFAIITWP